MAVGSDRTVTIEQAAKLMQLDSSRGLYAAVRKGVIPVSRESAHLKIPISWIRKTMKQLNINDPRVVMAIDEKSLAESFAKPFFDLGGGLVLVESLV